MIPLLALLVFPSAVPEDAPYRIGAATGPYFACDDRVIEDRWLVERVVVQPRRHPRNPLVERRYPWEGTGPYLGGSVLRDPEDDTFKMWYSVWNSHAYYNRLPFSYNVCYAESRDGISWERPALGVFDYQGSKENNCIKLGTDKTQNIDVCLNPWPDRFAGRFLSIHNQKGGVFVSSSMDGKSFTRLVEKPAISYHSDTQNNFVFDEVRQRWFLYCRPRAYAGYHKRRVSLQESTDLAHWSHERTILVPTETEIPEYYGMTVFRRGDLFFGVVQIYDLRTGFLAPELAWSGDGRHWTFLPKHPRLVALGEPGSWDAGMVQLADAPVIVGDTMYFYYGGFPLDHNTKKENVGSIGLLTAGRDRLVGVRPGSDEPGVLLTRPFLVGGRRLRVNAVVRGSLRAEVRTDGNRVVKGWSREDCDPVTESGYASEIRWGGRSLRDVPEKEIRVLFELRSAELFTFDLD